MATHKKHSSERPSWILIAISALLVALIAIALIWAISAGASRSGMNGQGGTGVEAYSGRGERKGGAGIADHGPESGQAGNVKGESLTATSTSKAAKQIAQTKPTTAEAITTKVITKPITKEAPDLPPDSDGAMTAIADIDIKKVKPQLSAQFIRGDSSGRMARRSGAGKSGKGSYAGRMGASGQSEDAVEMGLRWLAKVQKPDGHWSRDGDDEKNYHPVGVTGLATMAFLGAGYTHKGKSAYAETVRKALEWLISRQDDSGKFSSNFYEQGIAATAISEAYGMTRDHSFLRKPSRNALKFIISKMGPIGGYGYSGPGDDVHVTSFQVMAVKSGKLARLAVPKEVFPKLRAYYDRALCDNGGTRYSAAGRRRHLRKVTPARTALGLFCRIFLDVGKKNCNVKKVANLLDRTGPKLPDIFQTYYGTYGMFQMGGKYWKDWNGKFRDPLIALQVKEGDLAGSWPCKKNFSSRVIATSIRIMSLEVYYRYLPVNR